ncbi:MAG TPA: HPr family phosphocarrier protein [Bacillota bacterium]|nr:HPr family phosphocarrier protein [Bacillota bacterium]
MEVQNITVENPTGLHARPAALFIQAASKFKSNIVMAKGEREVDAKSILGILTLTARQGDVITLKATGEDAQEAVDTLAQLVGRKLDLY